MYANDGWTTWFHTLLADKESPCIDHQNLATLIGMERALECRSIIENHIVKLLAQYAIRPFPMFDIFSDRIKAFKETMNPSDSGEVKMQG